MAGRAHPLCGRPLGGLGHYEFENLSKHVLGLNPPAFELISDASASFGYTPSCIRKVLRPHKL